MTRQQKQELYEFIDESVSLLAVLIKAIIKKIIDTLPEKGA